MAKAKKVLSTVLVALFTVFTVLSYVPAQSAKAATAGPKINMVAQPNAEYKVGDRVLVKFNSGSYKGIVQYRAFLWKVGYGKVKELYPDYAKDSYFYKPVCVGTSTFTIDVFYATEPGVYEIVVGVKAKGAKASTASYVTTSRFTVKAKEEATIKEFAPLSDVTVEEGKTALLPATVKAVMTDGTEKEVAVTWPSVDTTKVGTVKVEGTVAGTTLKPAVNVVVKEVPMAVTSVAAASKEKVVLTFNYKVDEAVLDNFKVYEKGNEYLTVDVKSVAFDGNKVTLTLLNELEDDTDYTVSAQGVKAGSHVLAATTKDFHYDAKNLSDVASIAFAATTYQTGDTVEYIIKDKDGNDITADFSLSDLTIESSDDGVVDSADLTCDDDTSLTAGQKEYAVVNIKVDGTDVETGNTIITVKYSTAGLTGIGRLTLVKQGSTPNFAKPTTSLAEDTTDTYVLASEVLDADGDAYGFDSTDGQITNDDVGITLTYKSLNPTVAVIDANTGVITPVAEGSATLVVTATKSSTKYSKSLTIKVTAEAKPSTLSLDKTSVKLVIDSGINQTVKVKVLDQYGKEIDTPDGTLTWTINKTGLVDGVAKDAEQTGSFDSDGVATISLTPYAYDSNGDIVSPGIVGSGTITLKYKYTIDSINYTITKTVSVSTVEPDTFAGYAVSSDTTKLDLIDTDDPDYDDLKQGEATAQITVYKKDAKGNYIADATADATFEDDGKGYVTVDASGVVTPQQKGTGTVTVKVNGVKVGTVTYTVYDSTRVVTSVTQSKTVLTYDNDDSTTLSDKLFGTDGVFKAYDQYGDKIAFTLSDITVISSNTDIITSGDGATFALGGETGTVTLTIKVAKKTFTITVKVVD